MAFKSTRKTRRHKNNHQEAESQETPFFDKTQTKELQKKEDPFFQAKLTVGRPGDKYEREADAVADSVVSGGNTNQIVQQKEISSIQRFTLASPEEDEKLNTAEERMEKDKLIQEQTEPVGPEEELTQTKSEEEEEPMAQTQQEEDEQIQEMHSPGEKEEEEGESVQTKSASGSNHASNKVSKGIKESSGRGRKLPGNLRAEMESSIGHDFSQVHIHTGKDAVDMNKDLHAQAFTHGKDIYFNSGKYRPETSDGKRLLAHELTHVVQQSGSIQKEEEKGSVDVKSRAEKKRDELVSWFIGSLSINGETKMRIASAFQAFSITQMKRMKRAGVRFWHKGQTPPFLEGKFKLKTSGGQANYVPQLRIIGITASNPTSHIRHEIAHAWDHAVALRGRRLRKIETMSAAQIEREIGRKKVLRSDKSRTIKRAFRKYRTRVGGRDGRYSGEEKRLYAFDNPGTREGYSLRSPREFYAEGYSVFYGPHLESKRRLFLYAPELFRFLKREAKRYKLSIPTRKELTELE